ncbi:rRNA adenine N-6-methyltransferase family protein [Dendrosporobacter sp. 1207_IL3150]|uniref:rRNA adenine N-6-methyltransferase family protein n=1 Tax=Dendrosporobacter sp. 1207_IL3150 TaxID=3084054 RepID=UPI002FDAABA3
MSIFDRLRRRIEEEGFGRTIKYISLVGWDEFKTRITDTLLDLKYSGRLLKGHLPTAYKHLGANDVYHTDYAAMPHIFNQVTINPHDVLVDVGCGKGRVINYWLSQGHSNKIYGLELDPLVAQETAEQFKHRSNVTILHGDAISQQMALSFIYTILFLRKNSLRSSHALLNYPAPKKQRLCITVLKA